MLEAEADAAAAQERVPLVVFPRQVGELVGAQVAGADGRRPALERLDDLGVGLEMVFLGRIVLAVQVQELGAVEADAAGPAGDAAVHVMGELDVAPQVDLVPVGGHRRQVPEVPEVLLHEVEALLGLAEPGDGGVVGVNDHQAAVAVDDDQVAARDVGRDALQTHDGRDAHGPGDDRRVAGPAADIGGETQDLRPVQAGRLAGRQVVCDDDDRLGQGAEALAAGADEVPEEPFLDVVNVRDALGHVPVGQVEELLGVPLQDGRDGVLGGVVLALDQFADFLGDAGIGQQGVLDVEDGAEFLADVADDPLPQVADLGHGPVDGALEPGEFVLDLVGLDAAAGNTELFAVQNDSGGNRNARRNRDAFSNLHPIPSGPDCHFS